MTAHRLASRVERLEQQQGREPDRLHWRDLPPDDEITTDHLRRLVSNFSHEEALALLDAEPAAEGDDEGGAA